MELGELSQRLPAVREWIERLLEQHRPRATRVSELPFSRLSQYYAPETLQDAFCVPIEVVPTPPLSSLGLPGFEAFESMPSEGITYRDLYFVQRDRAGDESLHFHELVHVVQWKLLGPERFTLGYALGYIRSGGYRDNPFEQIAYALQAEFERRTRVFQVEPLVRRHLEQLVPV